MGNSYTSVFPNNYAWEQQEWNKIKKQTKEVRRETWVWKKAKRARKKRSPDGLSHPNQHTIIMNKIWYFIRNGKSTMKFNWQKNKMDLNIRKMTNHPPSPACTFQSKYCSRSDLYGINGTVFGQQDPNIAQTLLISCSFQIGWAWNCYCSYTTSVYEVITHCTYGFQ